MTFKISPKLQEFYNEMNKIISDSSYRPDWFYSQVGLCLNCVRYNYSQDELQEHLFSAGLSPNYPFNIEGDSSYTDEKETRTLYQNPARLAWIKQHATNHATSD